MEKVSWTSFGQLVCGGLCICAKMRSKGRRPEARHVPFVFSQRPQHWPKTDVWQATSEDIYSRLHTDGFTEFHRVRQISS